MKNVMVTGAGGYIGSTLVDILLEKGYKVVGLDRYFFGENILGATLEHPNFRLVKKDIREVEPSDFQGIDVVCDLAALSNDPAGELIEDLTYSINHQGRVRVASSAKRGGVKQYVLASSCSVYGSGAADETFVETSDLRPVSIYAKANLLAEQEILPFACDDFTVSVLRQATVFGLSKRMRFDLVVNLMTLNAVQKGKIFILGGGQQWRPLIHVKDTARVFASMIETDPSLINGEIFNVGSSAHNYQVLSLAYIARENIPFPIELDIVPDDNDKRNYNVSFEKLEKVLGFKPEYSPRDGVKEIYEALKSGKVDTSIKTITVKWYKNIIEAKKLIDSLALNGRLLD